MVTKLSCRYAVMNAFDQSKYNPAGVQETVREYSTRCVSPSCLTGNGGWTGWMPDGIEVQSNVNQGFWGVWIATLLDETELVVVIVVAIPCTGPLIMEIYQSYEYLAVKDT